MKLKIHSSEINRMMKTISQCINTKHSEFSNVCITFDESKLTIRSTSGVYSAEMSTPVLGGNGESFCVDGVLFAKVCAMCNGELDISTDGRTCTIIGNGRTRLPIVNANIPQIVRIEGDVSEVKMSADELTNGYNSVSYAVSQDQSRIQLTGILLDSHDDKTVMVSLDGFRMSVEPVKCTADTVKIIVPGTFMKMVRDSVLSGEDVILRSNGTRIEAFNDSILLSCGLLTGDFPDYAKLLPSEFRAKCIVSTELLRNALRSGSVVNGNNNLVKIVIGDNTMKVMSNSEQADFDADIPCATFGDELKIAFNQKYLTETLSAITAEKAVLNFITSTSPCVINGENEDGIRLILPVRVAG